MYGIFMESLVILKLYTGLKFLLLLTAIAWLFLFITEKDRKIRILLVYAPIITILLFLFPVSRKVFVATGLDGETYYRILWTIPMGIIFVYAACRLFAAHRRIGLIISAALIMLCGSLVYKSTYISKAENLYHIPDTVVRICDLIEPDHEGERVSAVMPADLIHFVRQYSAAINMPYGREMLVGQWDYYNAVYEAMEKPEVVNMRELLEATRTENCRYIVMAENKQTDVDPVSCGLLLLDKIDGYRVYEDPVTAEALEQQRQEHYGDEE